MKASAKSPGLFCFGFGLAVVKNFFYTSTGILLLKTLKRGKIYGTGNQ